MGFGDVDHTSLMAFVCLVEYTLVLRVIFPMLQMIKMRREKIFTVFRAYCHNTRWVLLIGEFTRNGRNEDTIYDAFHSLFLCHPVRLWLRAEG